MKKTHSLSVNFIFNLLYQISLYAVPLVTTPYLSRVLGPDGIGHYAFVQSIASYFVLAATLGTTLYGQRRIAALKEDPAAKTRAFYEIFALRLCTTLLAGLIYLLFVVPNSGDPVLYLLLGLDILAVACDISWLYQGDECFHVIAGCSGICKLMSIVLILLFVKEPGDIDVYAFIFSGMAVLGFITQWFCLKGHLEKRPTVRPAAVKAHLRPALGLFAAQVATQIYTVFDKTMIGLITRSDTQNGYYEQSQKVIRVLVVLATALGTVMASRVSYLWHQKRQRTAQELIQESFRATFAMAMPIAAGVALIARRFVPFYYGEGYEPVAQLLCILSLLLPIIGCSSVLGIQYLVPTDRESWVTRSSAVGAVVNVILNSVLIFRFQAVGAAIASIAAEGCVSAVQFWVVRKEIDLPRVAGLAGRYFACCLPMIGLGIILNRFMPQNLVGMMVIIFACAAVYAGTLLVLKDPLLKKVLEMIRSGKRQ